MFAQKEPGVYLALPKREINSQTFHTLEEAEEYLDDFLDGIQKGRIKPK